MMNETRFNVADLNAIETRVGAWVAGCHSLLNVFEPFTDEFGEFWPNGKDPYLAFASKLFNIPYEKLWADYKSKNGKEAKAAAKRMRQIAKPAVLGSIYGMGAGKWGKGKAHYTDHFPGCPQEKAKKKLCKCPEVYDRIRTGLWGYAYGMGIDMKQEEAAMATQVFRNSYDEICGKNGIWNLLEDAIFEVMHPDHPNRVRCVGPNDCIRIDKVNLLNRHPLMRITLPSGRRLHYLDAHINPKTMMPWKDREGKDVFQPALWYANEDQVTGIWSETTTHGGKVFENIVQGIARDVLAVKLLMFEKAGLPVRGHVHDEGITMTLADVFAPGVVEMVLMMSQSIGWAPGLLLGADGFEDQYYHK